MLRIEGLDRLQSALIEMIQTAISAERTLGYQGAVKYREALHDAVANQNFPKAYDPLDTRYAAWKQKMVGHEKFWKLFGDMIASLNVWQGETDQSWASGIPDNATNREEKSIEMYAGVNESKRELFGPVLEKLRYGKWKEMTEAEMTLIAELWKG